MVIKPASAAIGITDSFSISLAELEETGIIQQVYVSDSGEMYVAYSSTEDNKKVTLYYFNAAHNLENTIDVLPCEQDTIYGSRATGIAVDESGAVYVSLGALSGADTFFGDSCIRKYSSNGQEVPGFRDATFGTGTFFDNIAVNNAGILMVISRADQFTQEGTAFRFSSTTGQFLGGINGDPEGTQIAISRSHIGSSIATYQDNFYILKSDATVHLKVYDGDGVYVNSIINTEYSIPMYSMAIDPRGIIYISSGDMRVVQFNVDTGDYLSTGVPFGSEGGVNYLSPSGVYVATQNYNDNTLTGARMVSGPLYKPLVSIVDINDTSAVAKVEANPLEIADTADFEIYYVLISEEGTYVSNIIPHSGGVTDIGFNSLDVGTLYTLQVQFRNVIGDGNSYEQIQFRTSGSKPSGDISSAELYTDEDDGRNVLKVIGANFGSYIPAMTTSKVTLNGNSLPFCLDGTGGTYEMYIGAGYPEEMIGESPPCYWLMRNDAMTWLADSIMVWLPDNYPMEAEGTVSVNGSPVYTFNEEEGEPTLPVQPTVSTEAGTSLSNSPMLPSKPVFTGTAEPFATVKVTIHSDPVECITTAGSDGRWRCEFTTALPSGIHTVYVQVTSADNVVTELGPYPIAVTETQTSGSGNNSQTNNLSNTQTNRNRIAYVTEKEIIVSDDIVATETRDESKSNETAQSAETVNTANSTDEPQQDAGVGAWGWIIGAAVTVVVVSGVIYAVRKVLR